MYHYQNGNIEYYNILKYSLLTLLTIDNTINKTKKKKNLEWYTIKQDDRKSLLTTDITNNIDF